MDKSVNDRVSLGNVLDRYRRLANLSWKNVADSMQMPLVHCVSAILGHSMLAIEKYDTLLDLLHIPDADRSVIRQLLSLPPMRHIGGKPEDPFLYRLHEALAVHGPAIREIIFEQCGDGIVSAIDFSCSTEIVKQENQTRALIQMNGKFLPYSWNE